MNNVKRYNFLLSEIDGVFHDMALRFGLSDSAMQILYVICIEGEQCLLSEITRTTGTSKQTINSALRKLEREEIVCLKNVDSRKKLVCLTEKGREFSERTIRRVLAAENAVYASWTREEMETYLDLTQRYLNQIKKEFKEIL